MTILILLMEDMWDLIKPEKQVYPTICDGICLCIVGWLADFLHQKYCHFWSSRLLNNKNHLTESIQQEILDLHMTMKLMAYPVYIYISMYFYIFIHIYIAIFVSAITCSLHIYMFHIQLQMTSNHIFGASLRLSNVFMWVDSRFYDVWKSSRWFTMAPRLRWSVHIPQMLMESCIIFDANLSNGNSYLLHLQVEWPVLMEHCSQWFSLFHRDFQAVTSQLV